jgi:hypothetical protein
MIVELLTAEHADAVKHLFESPKFMGTDTRVNHFKDPDAQFLKLAYDTFCDTYLSDLKNYRAYGTIENDVITSYASGYMSPDAPEWYGTMARSKDRHALQQSVDKLIEYNEGLGRYRFYTLFSTRHDRAIRRHMYSPYNEARYTYSNDYMVPAKTKCLYTTAWHVLFNRTLLPVDTIVRCSTLKAEFRSLPIAGNI